MTVYVDHAAISATAGRHTSSWSHMTADTKEELHAFAARLGLRRSYFQTCVKARKTCPPDTCPHWHYDLTANKREQAVTLGAVQLTMAELGAIINARSNPIRPELKPAHVVQLPGGWVVAEEQLSPKQGDGKTHLFYWEAGPKWSTSPDWAQLFPDPADAAGAYHAVHGTHPAMPDTVQGELFPTQGDR